MNRGLLRWRVPAATSVDQETDPRRGAGTRGTREFGNGSARIGREKGRRVSREIAYHAQREANDP